MSKQASLSDSDDGKVEKMKSAEYVSRLKLPHPIGKTKKNSASLVKPSSTMKTPSSTMKADKIKAQIKEMAKKE